FCRKSSSARLRQSPVADENAGSNRCAPVEVACANAVTAFVNASEWLQPPAPTPTAAARVTASSDGVTNARRGERRMATVEGTTRAPPPSPRSLHDQPLDRHAADEVAL